MPPSFRKRDDSSITSYFGSQVDGLAAARLSGNQDGIQATPAGLLHARVEECSGGIYGAIGAEAQCKPGAAAVDVHAYDAAACSFENLNCELSEQAKSDDTDDIA